MQHEKILRLKIILDVVNITWKVGQGQLFFLLETMPINSCISQKTYRGNMYISFICKLYVGI